MKNIFIILGNGFTMDFLESYNRYRKENNKKEAGINVSNLFYYGEKIGTPWDRRPGFLSYKNTPALWMLGARPHQTSKESNGLIEEIISCANMFFDFVNDPDQKQKRLAMMDSSENRIYLRAYSELIVYLKHLFSWYDTLIGKEEIKEFVDKCESWGWNSYFKSINLNDYNKIVFVTYNYDVWLERILDSLNLKYEVEGFDSGKTAKIKIIKPHGSISFVPKTSAERYSINYSLDIEGLNLDELQLQYDNLQSCSYGVIIPPAGDSSRLRMTESWASYLRFKALENAKIIANDEKNTVVICGISYWHVDRKEIDELLINLNPQGDLVFINPNPPRDLNAVLISIFKNYMLQTSSDTIGGILNG